MENEIGQIKIELVNSIKATVRVVREVNLIYNRWLAGVMGLMVIPLEEIGEMSDLPLKLLQRHYVEGLP